MVSNTMAAIRLQMKRASFTFEKQSSILQNDANILFEEKQVTILEHVRHETKGFERPVTLMSNDVR